MVESREVILCNEDNATLIGGPVLGLLPDAHVTNPYIKIGKIIRESSLAAANARAGVVSINPRPALTIADGDTSTDEVFDAGICTTEIADVSKYVTPNAYQLVFSVGITERLHGGR